MEPNPDLQFRCRAALNILTQVLTRFILFAPTKSVNTKHQRCCRDCYELHKGCFGAACGS